MLHCWISAQHSMNLLMLLCRLSFSLSFLRTFSLDGSVSNSLKKKSAYSSNQSSFLIPWFLKQDISSFCSLIRFQYLLDTSLSFSCQWISCSFGVIRSTVSLSFMKLSVTSNQGSNSQQVAWLAYFLESTSEYHSTIPQRRSWNLSLDHRNSTSFVYLCRHSIIIWGSECKQLLMSKMMLILNWRFLDLRGYFLYLIWVISLASSTPWRAFLKFSLNRAKVSLSSLSWSSSRKALMFLDSSVYAANLSSMNSPNLIKLWLTFAFSPGMMSLKELAAPSTILSRCLRVFFSVITSPFTMILPSCTPGSMNISLPTLVNTQCFLCIPNAFILISLSSFSDVPTLISPSFSLQSNIPARVGSSEIFMRQGVFLSSSFSSPYPPSVLNPASLRALFLFYACSSFFSLSSSSFFSMSSSNPLLLESSSIIALSWSWSSLILVASSTLMYSIEWEWE